jgi:sulfur relay (sulfurtransferase) DsrF/TusC family protein
MSFPPGVLLVISGDPLKSPKPVEALRIALGLASAEVPIKVMLLDGAVRLISDDTDDVIDRDVLDKYLPTITQLEIPFLIPHTLSSQFSLDDSLSLTTASPHELVHEFTVADKVLAF